MYTAIFILVVGVLYAVWLRRFAKHRPQYVHEISKGRRCIWCHEPIGEGEESVDRDPDTDIEIFGSGRWGTRGHLACEEAAAKRHLWYYRLFLIMLALAATGLAAGTVSDALHGAKWSLADILSVLVRLLSLSVLVIFIRASVVPWARRVERAARKAESASKSG